MRSKGSDKIASNHNNKNLCDGMTNLESKGDSSYGPVDGTGSKRSGIVSSKAVHRYEIMNLRSRSKRKMEPTRENKLTMPALEMVTNYIHRFEEGCAPFTSQKIQGTNYIYRSNGL